MPHCQGWLAGDHVLGRHRFSVAAHPAVKCISSAFRPRSRPAGRMPGLHATVAFASIEKHPARYVAARRQHAARTYGVRGVA